MYYFLSIGFSHWKYGNHFSCEETTIDVYNKFIKNNYLHTTINWDLNYNEGTGHIVAVANDDTLEDIKSRMINKACEFSESFIFERESQIEKLGIAMDKMQNHPIYKMLNREKQINEILN